MLAVLARAEGMWTCHIRYYTSATPLLTHEKPLSLLAGGVTAWDALARALIAVQLRGGHVDHWYDY